MWAEVLIAGPPPVWTYVCTTCILLMFRIFVIRYRERFVASERHVVLIVELFAGRLFACACYCTFESVTTAEWLFDRYVVPILLFESRCTHVGAFVPIWHYRRILEFSTWFTHLTFDGT